MPMSASFMMQATIMTKLIRDDQHAYVGKLHDASNHTGRI